jgi:hypothetical protein
MKGSALPVAKRCQGRPQTPQSVTISSTQYFVTTQSIVNAVRPFNINMCCDFVGPRRGAACWDTAVQAGRSRVRIPDGVSGTFHYYNPYGRTMALGSTQRLTEMSTRNISWGGTGGRCVRLTTLRRSCVDCLEKFWEPQPPGTLRALTISVMGYLYLYPERTSIKCWSYAALKDTNVKESSKEYSIKWRWRLTGNNSVSASAKRR